MSKTKERPKSHMMPTFEGLRKITRRLYVDKNETLDLLPLEEGFYPVIPVEYRGQYMLLSVYKRSDGATVTLLGRATKSRVIIAKHMAVAKDAILGREFFDMMSAGRNNPLVIVRRPSGGK